MLQRLPACAAGLSDKKHRQDIDLAAITDEERAGNSEFFSGSSSKTPERYVHIRNHLVSMWRHSKPAPITKTKSRAGLKVTLCMSLRGKERWLLNAHHFCLCVIEMDRMVGTSTSLAACLTFWSAVASSTVASCDWFECLPLTSMQYARDHADLVCLFVLF